jgi:hypothetical protein
MRPFFDNFWVSLDAAAALVYAATDRSSASHTWRRALESEANHAQ